MLDFVTVTFSGDLRLLDIQARSFREHVDRAAVSAIYLIVNDARQDGCVEYIKRRTIAFYGDLAERVRVVLPTELGCQNGSGNPWRRQQALKLAAARICTGAHYVVLDAKNHFIRQVTSSVFVSDTGIPKTFLFPDYGERRAWLEDSLRYYGVDPAFGCRPALPTVTPYCVSTPDAVGMMEDVERRERCSISEFFAKKQDKSTEFLLYYAYLLHKYGSLHDRVLASGREPVCFFTKAPATAGRSNAFLDAAEFGDVVTFGVHRKRFSALNEVQRARIARIWAMGRLFDTAEAAREEIESLSNSDLVA